MQMITPLRHIKLLLQDNMINTMRTKRPIGCVTQNFQVFVKEQYLQNIRNECTMTKGGDRLRQEEVQMWLLKRKSNQQKALKHRAG
jgi:ABC-type polar amino acid transport system ATPase subunit